MNRRKFLSTTAMAALMVGIPLPIAAKTMVSPGDKTISAIEAVFAFMQEYGFHDVDTKAGLFSYFPKSFETLANLKKCVLERTLDWGSCDHWARVEFMLSIKQALTERFGEDVGAQLAWLDNPHTDLLGKTPRHMMTTLDYGDMMLVVKIAQET